MVVIQPGLSNTCTIAERLARLPLPEHIDVHTA